MSKWKGNVKYRSSWRNNSSISSGEYKVINHLERLKLQYIREVEFQLLKGHSFDFYLPQQNLIIEFDGDQHFSSNNIFDKGCEDSYRYRLNRDNIKNNFCKENSIRLLRLSLKNIKNIERLLLKASIPNGIINIDKNIEEIKKRVSQKNKDKRLLASAAKEVLKNKELPTTTIDGKVYYRRLTKL